jgi:uncharacterized membrane protein YfcA
MIELGYILASIMGILLGMLGGGGSILSVPILVYLMGVKPDDGPSYSLFVVGIAAAIGAVQYLRLKQFSYKAALLFGIPSMIAVYVNQRYIRPAIPEQIQLMGIIISRGTLLMSLFAVMMLLAAWSMVRKKNRQTPDAFEIGGPEVLKPAKILLAGLLEGFFTGLVGAGGGFIIVPALVTIAKLPMKKAVGTSLVIMAVKSLIGFSGALHDVHVDWGLLLPFTGIASFGILVGAQLSKKVAATKLKLAFGWFVLAMGAFIAIKTILDASG